MWMDDVKRIASTIPDGEALQGKTVLVTGATGLIGRALTDVLHCLGATVIPAGRREDVFFDAMVPDGLPDAEADYIVHLAGHSDPRAIVNDPVGTLMMSVNGTRRMLEAAKKWNAKMVYVSSSEIYGLSRTGMPWREEDRGIVEPLSSRASYAAGKRAAEALCVSAHAQYGTNVVIARPGHVYGPTMTEKDSHVAAQLLRAASCNEALILKSAGTQVRSWCHCLDCAAALVTLLTRGIAGEAYNVAPMEEGKSIRAFAETAASIAQVPLCAESATEAERRAFNPMECSCLDAGKLNELGWKAGFDLREGIRETIMVMKKER